MFCVKGVSRSETQLVEITSDNSTQPLNSCLRSKGCYVFYHRPGKRVYVWHGGKATLTLKRCAHYAAKQLKKRYVSLFNCVNLMFLESLIIEYVCETHCYAMCCVIHSIIIIIPCYIFLTFIYPASSADY